MRLVSRPWPRYVLTAAAVAAGTALAFPIQRWAGGRVPFVTFFPLVIVVAAFAGVGPGLLATALSALAVSVFWLEPHGRVGIARGADALSVGVFVLAGAVISFAGGALRAAHLGRRQYERLLRTVLDNTPGVIYMKDRRGVLQMVNRRFAELAGKPVEELIGGDDRVAFGDTPEVAAVRANDQRVLAEGRVAQLEETLRHPDGSLHTYLSVKVPVEYEGETVLCGFATDITDRKRVEEDVRLHSRELESVSERLRMAQEAGGVGTFEYDVAAGVSRGSEVFFRIFGAPPGASEYTAEQWSAVLHPDDRARVFERLGQLVDSPDATAGADEYRLRFPDGRVRWVSYRGRITRDAAGRARAIIGTIADVTERRLAQDAVRQSEARFRALSDGAPVPISVSREGRQLYVNAAFRRCFGIPEDADVVGASVLDQAAPEEHARILERVRRRYAGEPVDSQYQYAGVRRDGSGLTVEIRVAQIELPDGPASIAFLTDVTERQRVYEAERAARGEAERASQLKDEFLATLSHELRTPLNAILGWSQLLAADVEAGRHADDLAEGLWTIERNARAQTRLIEDLLDMSRVMSGKLHLEMEIVAPAEVVTAAAASIAPAADAKRLRLVRAIDPNAGPIAADAGRLQQAVWNLLTNAVKFTPAGGQIRVSLRRAPDARHVEISVADTGLGISPDFLPHAFERFRQADASTTRRHGGLGIGLALVKQLVELHGGIVRAESAGPGKGSTFTIQLPTAAAGAADEDLDRPGASADEADARLAHGASADRPDAPAPAPLAGVSVLVVDDEPDARTLARRVLEEGGAAVTTAATAREGLDALRARRPHVLLSDIGMPEHDGYQLIAWVRDLSPADGGHTPAAAFTALARDEDRDRALTAGFHTHVAKPVEPAELLTVVAKLAGRHNHA